MGASLSPAISQPQEGQLYGWLPLSNAYGISSRCNKIHNIIPNGIPSVVSQSPNLTAECVPERGNEPLAQGTALGNLEQHKMIRPDRAKAPHTIQHPRRRLGLYDCWSFRPPLYGRVFIDWLLWRKWCLTAFPPFWKTTWKNPTKTCRGKVTKEKLKSVKTTFHPSFFILHFIIFHSIFSHRLGFAAWKVSFHRPKGYVSPPETWSFVQRNLTFRKFIFSRPPDDKLTFV